jgi:hypothetical protein
MPAYSSILTNASLSKKKVKYLGYIIDSKNGICVDPEKIEATKAWEPPSIIVKGSRCRRLKVCELNAVYSKAEEEEGKSRIHADGLSYITISPKLKNDRVYSRRFCGPLWVFVLTVHSWWVLVLVVYSQYPQLVS